MSTIIGEFQSIGVPTLNDVITTICQPDETFDTAILFPWPSRMAASGSYVGDSIVLVSLPAKLALSVMLPTSYLVSWHVYVHDQFKERMSGNSDTLVAWGYGEPYMSHRFVHHIMDFLPTNGSVSRWGHWCLISGWLHSRQYEPDAFFHDLQLLREAYEAAMLLLTLAGSNVVNDNYD